MEKSFSKNLSGWAGVVIDRDSLLHQTLVRLLPLGLVLKNKNPATPILSESPSLDIHSPLMFDYRLHPPPFPR